MTSKPKAIYNYSGKNYAPKTPLDELAKQEPVTTPNHLTEALQKKYADYMDRDEQPWREAYETGQTVSNLTQGKLQLLRNPISRSYAFVKKDTNYDDRRTVGGTFQFYMTKLDAEWLSSRPELDPICPSSDDQIEELISSVKVIEDYYSKKFFDTPYEMRESDSAKCYGTWVTRFRYDPDCEDIQCELLDFPACRWDIRYRPEESSYFIYESKVSNSILTKLLNADIAPDGEGYQENYGLQVIEQIQKRGGNIKGQGKDRPFGSTNNIPNENVVTEMWLQPEAYCDIDIDLSESTLAGVEIKAGQSLLETFPEGMCIVGINGLKTIIGLYAENHKDHLVSGIYHLQSFSGLGKGVSDAVDVQKDLNDFHSQKMAYVRAHSTPATFYAQNLITEDNAKKIGRPRANIPIDFTNAPDGMKSINEAVQMITPANPAQGIWEIGRQLEDHLQMAFQVTNFSDGVPGVKNNTATGVEEGRALAQQMLLPQHLNKADHRRRAAKVVFNLFKRYMNVPKWFATKDINPITRGKYISSKDFEDVDIDFEIVANSETPKTPRAQEDSLSRLFLATGGFGNFVQAAEMNPDMATDVVTAFGAKLSIPSRNDVARICRKRVEQAKELLEIEIRNQQLMFAVTGEMPDNSNLAQAIVSQLSPPISPKEPYAMQKMAWLAELLDNDEMQYAPPELRHVIEYMIDQQSQAATVGQAQMAQDQNMATIIANMPSILGEQAMSRQNQMIQAQYEAEQQAAQQQIAQAQMGQQLALKQAEAEISETQADAADKRAQAQGETAHKQNLQLEAVRQLGKLNQGQPASK